MSFNKVDINKLFYSFITIHLILWTLIPSLTNNNLPLDTIEHLAWGSNLDWGFNKHPPAVAFFLEVFYQIFGAQDWAYYLLSQIFVVIAFIVVFKLAEELFKNKTLSLISVLLLEGIYFYNFTTPEFNVNVCQLPFWALCVYYSWKLFDNKEVTFKDCFWLGVFAAVGFLSKYLFIYLLLAIDTLFFYVIFITNYKKFDFKYLISIEVFYQVFGPQDWAYYLLSQIFVVIAFIVIFKFAEELFKNKTLSLISVLLLEGIYFYNFTTPEFNVNVCQLPFWTLCVYYSWKLFNNQEINFKDCLFLGIFAAIGLLSKYLFIYLLLAIDILFFYVIFIIRYKKFNFKYLISLEVFIALLVPHLIWLANNDYATITYGLARTGLESSSLLDHILYP